MGDKASISASEYVDEIIWIARLQATWAFEDKTEGFSMCYDLFEWLDIVHAEWTAIPTHQIYDIAHERYLKSLPTDIVPPPSLSTLLNPLTPVPLGFIHPTSPPHVTSPSNQQPTKLETTPACQIDDNATSKPTAASSDALTSPVMTHPRPIHMSTNTTQSLQDKGDTSQLHPKHRHHHGHKKRQSKCISEHVAGILPSHIPLPSFANTCSISTTPMSGIGLNIFVTPSLANYKSGMIQQKVQRKPIQKPP